MKIDSQDALRELLNNIKVQDWIKARLVLDSFDRIGKKEQRRILFELNRCEDDVAVPLLVFLAVRHEVYARQYPTLQETILSKALNSPDIIIKYLRSDSAEQLYYIKLAGDLHLKRAVPSLVEILLKSNDIPTLRAAIKSLDEIGDPAATNAISEFLYTDQEELIRPAIQALGRISTPTAMQRLAERLGKNEELDMLILSTFAEVQDDIALQKLNDALKSHSARIRNYTRSKLVSIGPKAVPLLIANLSYNDSDLQILTLNTLMEFDDKSAVQPIRKLLNSRPRDSNVRFAAYETLSRLPMRKGDYVIADGLTDPDDNVRMAAARAIDHNLNPILTAGIKNMIKNHDKEAVRIIRAIIDSKSKNIFVSLLEEKFFQETILEYLAFHVHPEIQNFYVEILINEKHKDLPETILRRSKEAKTEKRKPKICAVDDSRMILSVYRSVLTELGFEPVLFQYPAEAIEWLSTEKPLAVCTDLNMPDITGIELTQKVRQQYGNKELPIIMVTTQSEIQEIKTASNAGANTVLNKPFNAENLGDALKGLGVM
ncbi:MAG: response regulator [Thermodesulfobacteriota bacterium]|nr:response regulator [Thermodesulfobacteriota bacterium]